MFDKSFCGLWRVHINPATHPAPMRPLYGLAGDNVIPAPDHTGIKPSPVNVVVNRLPDNACSLFQIFRGQSSAAPLIVIHNDAARDPLLQGGSVHAIPQRLGGGDRFKFIAIPKTGTVFQYENTPAAGRSAWPQFQFGHSTRYSFSE